MTKEELAWVAGLYEGEGTVGAYIRKAREYLHDNGRYYKYKENCKITFRIGMTDLEPLMHVADILNLGEVYGPYAVKGGGKDYMKDKQYKDRYNYEIHGFEKVQQAMIYLWPWLCKRRKEQFKQAISAYLDYCKERG